MLFLNDQKMLGQHFHTIRNNMNGIGSIDVYLCLKVQIIRIMLIIVLLGSKTEQRATNLTFHSRIYICCHLNPIHSCSFFRL